MSKRKVCSKYHHRKKKKMSILPDINEDDYITLESSINNYPDETFLSQPLTDCTLDQSIDDNSTSDEDLPEGILNSDSKPEKLQAGDLVWIKHNKNGYFWPSYIKRISNKKASIYFLIYNKFVDGEKCFRYPINSRKMIRFHNPDYQKIIKEGKLFYQNKKIKNAGKKEIFEDTLDNFNNAVDLAELYTLHCKNKGFANEQEVFEFFQTNGVSLCHQYCIAEHNSISPIKQHSSSEECTSTNDLTLSQSFSSSQSDTDNSSAKEHSPDCKVNQNDDILTLPVNSNNETKFILTDEIQENENSDLASQQLLNPSLIEKLKVRTNIRNLKKINQRNIRIVEHILNGYCDDHLRNILKLKIPSKRMEAFFKKWDEDSLIPKSKNMEFDGSYFDDDEHLKLVCEYLKNFINSNAKYMIGLVKQSDLLFNVFLPEATIHSIHVVARKRLETAEKVFEEKCYQMKRNLDASYSEPLTNEERLSMKRKLDNFAKKMKSSVSSVKKT